MPFRSSSSTAKHSQDPDLKGSVSFREESLVAGKTHDDEEAALKKGFTRRK
jgi:hypothetical protein